MPNNKNTIIEKRDQIINRIVHLTDILHIKELFGWKDINFLDIKSIRYNKMLMTEELVVLLEELEEILKRRGIHENALNMNSHLDNDEYLFGESNLESWRKSTPKVLKKVIPWNTISIESAIKCLKEILQYAQRKEEPEIKRFLGELENIQIKNKNPGNVNKEKIPTAIEEWRGNIPELVKQNVVDGETITIDFLELEILDLIDNTKGTARVFFDNYLGEIEDLKVELAESNEEEESEQYVYDQLEIINKYKEGSVKNQEKIKVLPDESWRDMVPSILKYQIKDWKTASINDVYYQAKEILHKSKGTDWEIILEFTTEMSHIVFERKDEELDTVEEEVPEHTDEIADAIMSLVEMIINPRLEVLEIIKTRGGNIKFANLWDKPFTESLKIEVKDRDHWKCVICESDTDLHVHHKIPRDLGGIHHKDNLVTLCSSCHLAIETGDIKHAFTKCWANYQRRKYSNRRNNVDLSKDKKLLKAEVENSLDNLLVELNKKDEHKLMEDVMDIMKQLEIIFYG